MDMTELHTKWKIDPRRGLALHDAAGREVICLNGRIWLTMEGDTRDIVLEPGASFVVDRNGVTILAAQAPSEVSVSAPNQPRGWRARIADFINQTYGPAAIRANRKWIY
jgi:quercetin dioxygenase-like cupin family protein